MKATRPGQFWLLFICTIAWILLAVAVVGMGVGGVSNLEWGIFMALPISPVLVALMLLWVERKWAYIICIVLYLIPCVFGTIVCLLLTFFMPNIVTLVLIPALIILTLYSLFSHATRECFMGWA